MQSRSPETPLKVCILGLTLSGNRGAESMLLGIMDKMTERFGACKFDLVSVYPLEDRREALADKVSIISGKPIMMLAVVLPVSIAVGFLAKFKAVRKLLSTIPVFKSLLEADIVLDSGGVAFIDGRGLPLLLYNVALCYPPVLLGKKTVKLAQAMGPFKTPLNRLAASHVLPRLNYVIARGQITAGYLEELGLTNYDCCADTAFLMPISSSDRQQAQQIMQSFSARKKKIVGISPSVVVDDYCSKEGVSYASEMASFVEFLLSRGYKVMLLPHSVRPGKARMNNDLIICNEIEALLNNRESVFVIREDLSAGILREIIGSTDYYIASRFHSMVSALATCVPTVLVGWSHKYREVMAMFNMEEFAVSYKDFSAEKLKNRFEVLVASEENVRTTLKRRLPEVKALSAKNFEIVARVLGLDNPAPAERAALG
ncbi:MAG: hypothetical protein D6719_14025 [Candidatus Dadabacteria bacterium]|nr:MAG: hypothetical protein D6719_14025 [Candidatus Dadabacteria bacterium]